ncbi:response regulator transcription factor [Alcanivorax sp. IO_7]|nr:response regulator transcription factor [Alcanivorax sp. IO_7]
MAERPLRVAVVEDYGPMRALLVRELVAGGFRAVGYPDAASLWRHFPDAAFDLVVLNIGLPDEDGFSVSRRLRRDTRVPVVMVSGYGSNEHQLLGLREGADAYLVKPVDIHVLLATLERLARRLGLTTTARRRAPLAGGWRRTAGCCAPRTTGRSPLTAMSGRCCRGCWRRRRLGAGPGPERRPGQWRRPPGSGRCRPACCAACGARSPLSPGCHRRWKVAPAPTVSPA